MGEGRRERGGRRARSAGPRPEEESARGAAEGRGGVATHLGDAAARRSRELRALPAPGLGFERRKPGM